MVDSRTPATAIRARSALRSKKTDLQSQTGPFQLLRIFRLTGASSSHIFLNTGERYPG